MQAITWKQHQIWEYLTWRWYGGGGKWTQWRQRWNVGKRTLCWRLACAPFLHNNKSAQILIWGWPTPIHLWERCCHCLVQSRIGQSRDLGCHRWGGRISYSQLKGRLAPYKLSYLADWKLSWHNTQIWSYLGFFHLSIVRQNSLVHWTTVSDYRLFWRRIFFIFNHHHLPPWGHDGTWGDPYSTEPLPLISPSIFMSASFVYSCLTCDHHDTCWMHCTSWGSCWWSFSCFSLLESGIWICNEDERSTWGSRSSTEEKPGRNEKVIGQYWSGLLLFPCLLILFHCSDMMSV